MFEENIFPHCFVVSPSSKQPFSLLHHTIETVIFPYIISGVRTNTLKQTIIKSSPIPDNENETESQQKAKKYK